MAESITDEVVSDLAKGTVPPPEFDDDHQKAYVRACIQEFVGRSLRSVAKHLPRETSEDKPMPFQDTLWWKLFHDDRTRTPGTKQYDMWLLRFRVPMRVFEQLVERFEREGWATPQGVVNSFGRPAAPFVLKLMAALRYLSRGECFDTISELTQNTISEPVIRSFVKDTFLPKMFSIKDEYIYFPKTPDELSQAESQYSRVGLSGCVCFHESSWCGATNCAANV